VATLPIRHMKGCPPAQPTPASQPAHPPPITHTRRQAAHAVGNDDSIAVIMLMVHPLMHHPIVLPTPLPIPIPMHTTSTYSTNDVVITTICACPHGGPHPVSNPHPPLPTITQLLGISQFSVSLLNPPLHPSFSHNMTSFPHHPLILCPIHLLDHSIASSLSIPTLSHRTSVSVNITMLAKMELGQCSA
jgi:hypothetical protein